jgi:hypothetical protein
MLREVPSVIWLTLFTAAGVAATFWLALATRRLASSADRQIKNDIETREYYWQQEAAKEESAARERRRRDAESVIVEATTQQVDLRFPASYQIKQVRSMLLAPGTGPGFSAKGFHHPVQWVAPGHWRQPVNQKMDDGFNRHAFEWTDPDGVRWVNLDGKITRCVPGAERIESAAWRLDVELRTGPPE